MKHSTHCALFVCALTILSSTAFAAAPNKEKKAAAPSKKYVAYVAVVNLDPEILRIRCHKESKEVELVDGEQLQPGDRAIGRRGSLYEFDHYEENPEDPANKREVFHPIELTDEKKEESLKARNELIEKLFKMYMVKRLAEQGITANTEDIEIQYPPQKK